MVVWNPFDPETADNPFPVYRRLRDEAPVYHNPDLDVWALSRYDDVLEAHIDHATFSSSHGTTIENSETGQPFLISKDPPEHTWHRKVVSRMFTPRRIGSLEPFIRSRAVELLDAHLDSGHLDVVEDFSIRLPLDVIGELIGIPVGLRNEVHELSDRLAVRTGEVTVPEEAEAAMAEIGALFYNLVVDRRRNPGDDIISLLMSTPVVDDEGNSRMLDDVELAQRFLEMAFAGHETVAKLVANGVVALAWWPDQRAELVADPGLLPEAVEEMLRWDPPSHYQGRWTMRPVELHGEVIPADVRVVLITGAAVHDEREFPDPERFDIHRGVERHVSLGFGVHLCLGAALARLETRIAFEELLARVPEYEIEPDGVVRAYSANVRGLQNLPITFAAR